jgi:hypothetical protein
MLILDNARDQKCSFYEVRVLKKKISHKIGQLESIAFSQLQFVNISLRQNGCPSTIPQQLWPKQVTQTWHSCIHQVLRHAGRDNEKEKETVVGQNSKLLKPESPNPPDYVLQVRKYALHCTKPCCVDS